ncbi:MAG: HAD-IA family hydrolase [Candidatus ainarchaeum sp.]|nr:HAD-IA family hydrolase [Candidatus ainarchaeum sp.]
MYRLVIFDFDDTLLTLGVSWTAVKKDVLTLAKQEGIAVSDQHLVSLGNSLSNTPERKKAIDEIYLRHEMGCVQKKAYTVFPDMFDLAKEIKASGRMTAIASGNHSSTIKRILSDLDALDSFDYICGRESVENNKPAPDQLNMIMERLGIDKQEAFFVGDSMNDEAAAKSANISYFKIRPGNKSDIIRLRKLLFI